MATNDFVMVVPTDWIEITGCDVWLGSAIDIGSLNRLIDEHVWYDIDNLLGTIGQLPDGMTTIDAIEATKRWTATLTSGSFSLDLGVDASPLEGSHVTNDGLYKFVGAGDLYLGIGFEAALTPSTTLEGARMGFKHIALDFIPVPGFSVPDWKATLSKGVSSFSEGVLIESICASVDGITLVIKVGR